MQDDGVLAVALSRFGGRYHAAVRRGAAACPFGLEEAAKCSGLGVACPTGSCLERARWTPEERAAFDQEDDAGFLAEAWEAAVERVLPDGPVELGPAPSRPAPPRAVAVGRGSLLPPTLRDEILSLRAAGLSYQSIADQLGVGHTTAWHVGRQAEGAPT